MNSDVQIISLADEISDRKSFFVCVCVCELRCTLRVVNRRLQQTDLSFSLKAVKELHNIWMLKTPHNLYLPLETPQLLFRSTHLRHELQSHHLMDTHRQTDRQVKRRGRTNSYQTAPTKSYSLGQYIFSFPCELDQTSPLPPAPKRDRNSCRRAANSFQRTQTWVRFL